MTLLAVIVYSFAIACKKDNDTGGGNTTPLVDVRDRFIGTWEGQYYIDIPNLPADNPLLSNLPDSVPTTITITRGQGSVTEILVAINNSLTGNRSAKAFVNGNRYYYEPFTTKFSNVVNVSLRGDGLLGNDGNTILEEGSLKTDAFSFPGFSVPPLVGVWSSKLKRKN